MKIFLNENLKSYFLIISQSWLDLNREMEHNNLIFLSGTSARTKQDDNQDMADADLIKLEE